MEELSSRERAFKQCFRNFYPDLFKLCLYCLHLLVLLPPCVLAYSSYIDSLPPRPAVPKEAASSLHRSLSPHAMAAQTSPSTTNLHGLPPIPPSPTHSFASTAFPTASINLPPPPPPLLPKNFLSRSDVAASILAYQGLLDAAKVYRKAMAAVAAAASSFGAALESCAKCMASR